MKKTIIAIICAGCIILTQAAYAQEVVTDNDSGVGYRSMGMGWTGIAGATDLSAIHYNPAALARLRTLEVQLGINHLTRDIDTTVLSAEKGDDTITANTDYTTIGSFGVAHPVPTSQGSLVFAVAYNRVKDFEGRIKLDGYLDDTEDFLGGYQTAETVEKGGMGKLSFAGAVDVSPNVSLGLSLDAWFGTYDNTTKILFNDYTEGYEYSQVDQSWADDTISAWSLKPAFLYHNGSLRFGGYMRLPMTYYIDEKLIQEGYSRDDGLYWDFQDSPHPDWDEDYLDYDTYDDFEYKVKTPIQFGTGVSFGTPGSTMVMADMSYENWEQAELELPTGFEEDPNYFRDRYRTVVNWSVGMEQPIAGIFMVRAGYAHRPLPFKGPRSEGASEIKVDNGRDYLTLGLGMKLDESFSLDFAYAHGFWSEDEAPLTVEESRNRLAIGITYRLPAGSK